MKDYTGLIAQLQLQPHPEGGYFRETYRSNSLADFENIGVRNYSTCIYYLLTADTFSAFHRIKQDEIWHFYAGEAVNLHLISPEAEYVKLVLGSDIVNNQVPQLVVPSGYWFAAQVQSTYALVGCTVAPGFDFNDFELAKRDDLILQFPQFKQLIIGLTRK